MKVQLGKMNSREQEQEKNRGEGSQEEGDGLVQRSGDSRDLKESLKKGLVTCRLSALEKQCVKSRDRR